MGASVKHTASYIAVRDSAGRNVAHVHKSQGGVGVARLFAESLDLFKSTGKGPSELAASLADAQAEIARLRGALEKYEAVREEMFGHFCSNGLFNAWGKEFNCSGLNDAHLLAREALK